MKNHKIKGGGGTRLHVVETGNARGRPILFIHGFSQCWLAWSRQMDSDLADDTGSSRWTCAVMVSRTSLATGYADSRAVGR